MNPAMSISGVTRLCFVVGDPTFQLRTPAALNRIATEHGIDVVSLPANVVAGDLGSFLTGLRAMNNAVGAVLTIPHKQTGATLCDELGPQASLSGAVNTIRRHPDGRLIGEGFDGLGFVAGLHAQDINPEGMTVVLLGAGGAASSIAIALAAAGVKHITLVNRTPQRLTELQKILESGFPALEITVAATAPSNADLFINATPVGMSPGDQSLLPAGFFPSDTIAADVIMSNELTPFLAAAHATGARTHGGTHMLQGQIRLIAEFLGIADQT